MAAANFSPQQLQNIRDFAAQWGKIISRRAAGEAGPPREMSLAAMERLAQAAAQGLLEGTLATLLEQQAATLPAHQPCPDCQQLCPVHYEPHELESLGGSLTYREPKAHCPACRRDFFPSAARPGSEQPPLHS